MNWRSLKCFLELKNIYKVWKKNFYNPIFYIYLFLTIRIWKKLLLLIILVLIVAWVKIIFCWLLKGGVFYLRGDSIVDVTVFNLLMGARSGITTQIFLLLSLDLFVRYFIIFIFAASVKSVYLCTLFFDSLSTWKPSYSYWRFFKFHRFVVNFIKLHVFKGEVFDTEFNHRILKKIFIKKLV